MDNLSHSSSEEYTVTKVLHNTSHTTVAQARGVDGKEGIIKRTHDMDTQLDKVKALAAL